MAYDRLQARWLQAGPGLDRWLIRIIVLGIFVRLMLVITTFGTNDTASWGEFAESVLSGGYLAAYEEYWYLNHPPVAVSMVAGLSWMGERLNIAFASLLRLPAVFADILAMSVLFRTWRPSGRRWALTATAAYALSPVTILISAYHGNTDSIYGALLLVAAVLVREKRSLAGGLVFALAFNIKLIPLVAGPALLAAAMHRRQGVPFLTGAAVGLVGFIPLAMAKPEILVDNILTYNPNPTQWGLAAIGSLGQSTVLEDLSLNHISNVRSILIAVIVIGLFEALRRGQRDPVRLAIWPATALIVFSPSIAPQHLIVAAALLYAGGLGWAFIWSAAMSAYVIAVYGFYIRLDLLPSVVSEFNGPVPQWVVAFGLLALFITAIAGWKLTMNVADLTETVGTTSDSLVATSL